MLQLKAGVYKKEDAQFLLDTLEARHVQPQCTETAECSNCSCRIACNDMEYVVAYLKELLEKGCLK